MGQTSSKSTLQARAGGSSEVDAIGLHNAQPENRVKVLYGDNTKRNILLVGTSGRGKSSTGNSVFGEDLFETSDSMDTDPDCIVCQSKEVDGLKLTICDALTILDQRMIKSEAQADVEARLTKCFEACPDGFHFIIFVFSYTERVTPEESFAAEILVNTFGTCFLTEQAICLFTCGENFDLQRKKRGGPDFDTWYRHTQDPFLQKVSSNMKALMFYNIQTDRMVPQRREILEAVRNCRMCVRPEQHGYIFVEVKSNDGEHLSPQQPQSSQMVQSSKRNENNTPPNAVSDEQSTKSHNKRSQRQPEEDDLKRQRMSNGAKKAHEEQHDQSVPSAHQTTDHDPTQKSEGSSNSRNVKRTGREATTKNGQQGHRLSSNNISPTAKVGRPGSVTHTGNPTSNKEWNLILVCNKEKKGKDTKSTLLGRKKNRNLQLLKTSRTQTCSTVTQIGDTFLKVMDGRSLLSRKSTNKTQLELMENILQDSFMHFSNGFYAFTFVLSRMNELENIEKKTVKLLKGMLGENIIRKHCILLCPFGEKLFRENLTLESWRQKQDGPLRDLINECQNRVVFFYNSMPEKREESINKLTAFLREIEGPYTHDMFEDASSARIRFIKQQSS